MIPRMKTRMSCGAGVIRSAAKRAGSRPEPDLRGPRIVNRIPERLGRLPIPSLLLQAELRPFPGLARGMGSVSTLEDMSSTYGDFVQVEETWTMV